MKTLLFISVFILALGKLSQISDNSQRYTYATERINRIADSAMAIGESADNAYYNAIEQIVEENNLSTTERLKLLKDYYLADNENKSNF